MVPVYEVRISQEASADLLMIHRYIRQDSPQNADLVMDRLLNAIDELSTFPHRYKIYQSASKPDRVVRSVSISSFTVYFRILEADRIVRILTIRRGARRQPKRFK